MSFTRSKNRSVLQNKQSSIAHLLLSSSPRLHLSLHMATLASSSSSTIQCTQWLPPTMAQRPPASLVFGGFRHSSVSPDFSQLQIHQRTSNQLVYSFNSSCFRVSHRVGSSVFCKASSDTALDVPSVNDDTWQSLVLKAEGPVMVEFWAPWCGPCRMIHPLIDELSKQYNGRLKCYKVNTDDSPSIATQYGIRSIPTIMIFVDGEKKDAVIGAVPKTTVTACIEKFL